MDDAYFAICFNTRPYTYLGNRPLDVAPDASLDRGLVVLAFRSLGLATMLPVVASALGSGRLARSHRRSHYRVDLEGLEVTGHGPFPYQVDGDYLGEAEHLVFRHEPAALRLVVP